MGCSTQTRRAPNKLNETRRHPYTSMDLRYFRRYNYRHSPSRRHALPWPEHSHYVLRISAPTSIHTGDLSHTSTNRTRDSQWSKMELAHRVAQLSIWRCCDAESLVFSPDINGVGNPPGIPLHGRSSFFFHPQHSYNRTAAEPPNTNSLPHDQRYRFNLNGFKEHHTNGLMETHPSPPYPLSPLNPKNQSPHSDQR